MSQRTLLAIGLVVGLGIALGAAADQKTLFLQGAITGVNAKAREVNVTAGDGHLTVKLADSATLVAEGNKPIAFKDLKKGERVKVEYTVAGGVRLAQHVELVGTPAVTKTAASGKGTAATTKPAAKQPVKM
jgi:hypothetical protein